MSKAASRFKTNLAKLIEEGIIKKIELHRKTGISRASIDNYLESAVPDLNALDKIAEALEMDPADLIKGEADPLAVNLSDPVIREVVEIFSSVQEDQRPKLLRSVKAIAEMLPREHNSDRVNRIK